MRIIFFFIASLFIQSAFAQSGYSQLDELFQNGQILDLKTIKQADQGIYVGRCFKFNTDVPAGTFSAFKNQTQDSGPIQVDPVLYITFGSSDRSNYFDTVNVSELLRQAPFALASLRSDNLTYQVTFQGWWLQYRQNGQYIIERNISGGFVDSYCYYYQFRDKTH